MCYTTAEKMLHPFNTFEWHSHFKNYYTPVIDDPHAQAGH